MARCDLCGGQCAASELESLHPQYQAHGVADLCPGCAAWASATKDAHIRATRQVMHNAIAARLGIAKAKRPWWRRLFRGAAIDAASGVKGGGDG